MFQKSKKNVTEQEALLKLSALCSQAEHSSGEMLDKMRRWGMPQDMAERVVDRLVDERFVDDERYARFFARDKIRFDRWGRRKIEQGLYRKGVARDIIGRVLDEVSPDDYAEALAAVLASKRRTVKADSEYELNTKLIKFALGRGFGMDIIRRCLDDADDCCMDGGEDCMDCDYDE